MTLLQPTRRPSWLLAAIIAAYVVLGVLFAVYTPAWQAPDEPAHYNYVRYLAEQHRFPVLKAGDYPAAYLDEIKAAHFPPGMTIAPLRYEFHQPPLYYSLAVPIYWLFGGALLPLRLLSVALGAVILLVVYAIGRELWPAAEWPALGATAFVAFLPMHLAVTAAVTNDPLAELLLAAILLLAIRALKVPAGAPGEARTLVLLGIATGVALVTKSGIYIAVPLVLAVLFVREFWLGERRSVSGLVRSTGLYLLPALALALPWWLRNLGVYGGLDVLGLGRHDAIVAGQLRTADYLAAHGAGQWVRQFATVTFHSFWGQFGWMGVLLDERLYQALAVLSALALAGLVAWAVRAWRGRQAVSRWQLAGGALLAAAALLTAASYLWYNAQFVQFQGRYLFPTSVALGLAAAVGWHEALRRERAVLMAGLLLAAAAVVALLGLLRRDLPGWSLLMLLAAAALLAVRSRLPGRWSPAVHAIPYVALAGLDLVSLFLFIVPQLAL
jgi:4-amino-4-deoxy-L-arabinose transferase-like glycosyltransferase